MFNPKRKTTTTALEMLSPSPEFEKDRLACFTAIAIAEIQSRTVIRRAVIVAITLILGGVLSIVGSVLMTTVGAPVPF